MRKFAHENGLLTLWSSNNMEMIFSINPSSKPSKPVLDIRRSMAIDDAKRMNKKLIEVSFVSQGENGVPPNLETKTLYDPEDKDTLQEDTHKET